MGTVPPVFPVALLAVPQVTGSTLHGLHDLFSSVGRDWDMVMGTRTRAARMPPVIVAAGGRDVPGANGVLVRPGRGFEDCECPALVCVPEVLVPPGRLDQPAYLEAGAWLREMHERGAVIAGVCSGSLLLAEAGLLDDGEATTHWGYCEMMKQQYPAITVCPGRALVATGPGHRVLTAGGGSSWHDLALYLVARFAGVEEAVRIARLYLIEFHQHGQAPYAALAHHRQRADPVIGACQEWIAMHYTEAAPVLAMVSRSGLPERSFKRRFKRATGLMPMEYVHTLRIEEAKQMLEASNLPIEAVAEEVGYEDASFFRRLFRRRAGMSPIEYRRRFGSLRRSLSESAAD
jgi:transcriptional regulator GlxA family with amidase domain